MKKIDRNNIEQEINRYINGKLSESEVEELWSVLIQDDEYMDYLKTAANIKEIAESEEGPPVKRVKSWIYAGAAVIVLLLAVLAILFYSNSKNESQLEPIAAIELPFTRSADMTAQTPDREEIIREAVTLYYKGHFEEAIDLLTEEKKKSADLNWIARLNITMGILHYNDDKFKQAAFYFSDVVKYEGDIALLKLEKAYWYLGNAYFQMLELEKAEAAMRKAYTLDGAYSRVAKLYLDAMEGATS